MIYLLAIGFISILGQVALLRELSVAFYGVDLIYSLALGIWLLWTAAGTFIGRWAKKPSFAAIQILFVVFALLLPADIAFIRSIRVIFSGVTGAYLPFQTQILAMAASLLPISLVLGLMFQWTARAYLEEGKSLAQAYALESLGGLAGGICSTLFLIFHMQNFLMAVICAILALLMAFAHGGGRGVRLVRPPAGALAILLILAVLRSSSWDRQMTLWTHPHLTETRDSPYGRVTVTSLNGQISVFENDALSFETEGTDAEEFVQLAALQHPAPSHVLILGGGMDGTLRETLKLKPARADYVELNPALLDIVAPLLPLVFQESLRANNVRLHIGDPREFLVHAEKYDLILVGMPEPTSGQANRFYTSEFFQLCLKTLHSCGILAFRLQSSENFWTPQLTRRMTSIYRAAKSVFPDVLMLPGSTNIVLCSTEPLTRNPDALATRLEDRGIKTRLVSPAFIQYIYGNDRFRQVAETLESGSAPTNTDSRPICYQYSVMFWLSKFFPSLGSWDIASVASRKSRMVSLWLLLAFALPFLYCLSGLRWPLRRALLMGSAGFIGMVFETSLILLYQVKRGMLFQDLGILLMSFMAGLSLGAVLVDKGAEKRREREKVSRTWGSALIFGFGFLGALLALRVTYHSTASLLETALFLLAAGFLVSGMFAYTTLRNVDDQHTLITPLYSADLIGGCFGSLAGSLLLVPIAGLTTTSLSMIPLAFICALLL